MAHIPSSFFDKEHITRHAIHASAELTEQVVYCLELVAQLSAHELHYQFKGGNSLLLLLSPPQRFSIDVDIATNESTETLEAVLDRITANSVFTTWKPRAHKTKPWIALSSYYLYYRSHFSPDENAYIMLDVQLSLSPYRTRAVPVRCMTLYESDTTVQVPIPASLVGDKLLTLGPSTYGIPTGKGKQAQRLKHAFDVSSLLTTDPSLSQIRESFTACMDHEAQLQGRTYDPEAVRDDTVAFCHAASAYASPPAPATTSHVYEQETAEGITPFAAHLIRRDYTWQDLQYDTARAALCISAVHNNTITDAQLSAALAGTLTPSARAGDHFDTHAPCNDTVAYLWDMVASWTDVSV